MKVIEIVEVYHHGKMREPSDKMYISHHEKELASSTKVKDLSDIIVLWKKGNIYYLTNKGILIGHIILSPVDILSNQYLSVDGIFIRQQYRKTSAAKWLLLGLKEVSNVPIVVDGAIFQDGQDLIKSIAKHKFFRVFVLNKTTGEKSELNEPVNDMDKCYVFEKTSIGFNRQIFIESMGPTWIPYFEEI